MLELTLIRHARTPGTATGLYQGAASDPDLSVRGAAEARTAAQRMADLASRLDEIWSSDLRRAWRTAELVFPDRRIQRDPRLRELDFGAFDGLSYEENLARYGRRFRRWLADPHRTAPPGGERLRDLEARLDSWLADRPARGRVAVVAHGGPIRSLLARALGVEFGSMFALDIPPAAAFRVWYEPDGRDAGHPTAPGDRVLARI